MTTLLEYNIPQDIPEHVVEYLTTDTHAVSELDPATINYITDGNTASIDHKERLTKRTVTLALDWQQPATPVSVYARLRVLVEPPNSQQHLQPDAVYTAWRLAYHIRRYALSHSDIISCDVDGSPTMTVDGTRSYAYMVLLLTVPTN